MEAGTLGVDGYLANAGDVSEEVVGFLLGVDVEEGVLVRRGHSANLAD